MWQHKSATNVCTAIPLISIAFASNTKESDEVVFRGPVWLGKLTIQVVVSIVYLYYSNMYSVNRPTVYQTIVHSIHSLKHFDGWSWNNSNVQCLSSGIIPVSCDSILLYFFNIKKPLLSAFQRVLEIFGHLFHVCVLSATHTSHTHNMPPTELAVG